jgi:tetratricopeptide (TPR) repeat protein
MDKRFISVITFLLIFTAGCATTDNIHLQKAIQFANKSQDFYQKAIQEYKWALEISGDKATINFKLGQLYYHHGDYDKAIEILSSVDNIEAKKILAYSYYKSNNFTDALSIFNKLGDLEDDEYLYYYGLTSEKLNLFDQAKKIYQKLKSQKYIVLAQRRIKSIDSLIEATNIKELDPYIYKIIKDSPTQKDYPQASALILLSDERYEVSNDNTAVFERHFMVKILNERGKDFGEVEIGYDSTYEKVELIYARTIKPDGKVIQVGDRHIRDVSKYLNYPLYSNARALIISMPEVAVGSIIEYKVKIYRSRLINKKDFYIGYLLQESEPVILAKFMLSVPKERKINFLVVNEKFNYFNAELSPKIIEENNKKIYYWEFQNIPEVIPEPQMPPTTEVVTSFLISTFNSWQEIYKWWRDLAEDKIYVNDQIKQKIAELIKDKQTDIQKAQAIYNWCAQEIRYVAVEYGQAGHEPHKAEDIFKNKYGDCKDQAVLLVSMLREIGLDAYLVLIGTKGVFKLQESFPALMFNHAIVCLRIDGRLIFLDPTGETVSFGDLPASDQDRKVLVFFDDEGKILTTPLFPATQNSTKIKTSIEINNDESIQAVREVITSGFYNQTQRWWLKYTKPILIKETLKEKANSISPGAELIDYKIENLEDSQKPIRLTYRFNGPEYLIKAGRARIIPNLGSIDLSTVAKEERSYAIDIDVLGESTNIVEFYIPHNFKISFMPKNITYNTKWFNFENLYEFNDGKIIFTQRKIMKTKYISQEDYKDFKNTLERLSREINQCIVLEEIGS